MSSSSSSAPGLNRRQFISRVGLGALALGLGVRGVAATAPKGKKLQGIFPIAQTPFTTADKLDVGALVKQLEFLDRGGVHGYVWPQLASEWTTLSEGERLEGMAAIGQSARKLRPAIILGVQGPDLTTVRRYIGAAEKAGADAIISLPPADTSDVKAVAKYYQDVGHSTALPMFVQAVGNMDVDLLLELYRTVPNMRFIKDEAGDPLQRVKPLREQSHDEIKVFSGNHGRKMIDELAAGFSGSMPAAGLADLYATTFDLWQAGKQDAARESHARTLAALDPMLRYGMEGMKYVLEARGVFTTHAARTPPATGSNSMKAAAKMATSGGAKTKPLDEAGQQELRALIASLKPHLKA